MRILFTLLIFISSNANSVYLDNLFETEIVVSSKNKSEKYRAFKLGLDKVLIKVSSNPKILNMERIKKAKDDIDNYISKYAFKAQQEQLILEIAFNESQITNLLKSLDIGYLGKNRPLTIIWISRVMPFESHILGGGDGIEVTGLLEQLAAERGLPIVIPLLDLTDRQLVKEKDVLNFSENNLVKGSKRYFADAILAGNLRQFAGQWRTSWQLIGGLKENWQSKGDSIQDQLTELMNNYADNLVSKYSVSFKQQSTLNDICINIFGVDRIEKYAKVMNYLQELSITKAVDLVSINNDKVTFNLNTNLDRESVAKVINLDRVLLDMPQDSEQTEELNYRVQI